MRRPWLIGIVFGGAFLVGLLTLAALTRTMLRLEASEQQQQREVVLEESVRLALWRIDAFMATLIGIENGRPPEAYLSFYTPRQSYLPDEPSGGLRRNALENFLPSPLLRNASEYVTLYFSSTPAGLESPMVPPSTYAATAADLLPPEEIDAARTQLARLAGAVAHGDLDRALGTPSADIARNDPDDQAAAPARTLQSAREQSRSEASRRAQMSWLENRAQQAANSQLFLAETPPEDMRAVWVDEQLLLLRRATLTGRNMLQGCWLDWPALREHLLREIDDLLPSAALLPETAADQTPAARRLATLPVRIDPGPFPLPPAKASATRPTLLIAWGAFALASLALGALLLGTVRLSERRAAFVSAVTHELRTPLTTFRLYTEMLADERLPEESQRQAYLRTLRAESERLAHIVENVLMYARIERGSPIQRQPTTVADLVARIEPALQQRVALADGGLDVAIQPGAAERTLDSDPGAIERVLFNLVDNACKYALGSHAGPIELDVSADASTLVLRVRDHGPGIPAGQIVRLMRPFQTGRGQRATGGIGLGLSLSTRLAEALGGTLQHEAPRDGGTAFTLRLPLTPDHP